MFSIIASGRFVLIDIRVAARSSAASTAIPTLIRRIRVSIVSLLTVYIFIWIVVCVGWFSVWVLTVMIWTILLIFDLLVELHLVSLIQVIDLVIFLDAQKVVVRDVAIFLTLAVVFLRAFRHQTLQISKFINNKGQTTISDNLHYFHAVHSL